MIIVWYNAIWFSCSGFAIPKREEVGSLHNKNFYEVFIGVTQQEVGDESELYGNTNWSLEFI